MENEIMVMFGTETGNAEELAETAVGMASNYDLAGKLLDMEDVTVDMLKECKRLMKLTKLYQMQKKGVNMIKKYIITLMKVLLIIVNFKMIFY